MQLVMITITCPAAGLSRGCILDLPPGIAALHLALMHFHLVLRPCHLAVRPCQLAVGPCQPPGSQHWVRGECRRLDGEAASAAADADVHARKTRLLAEQRAAVEAASARFISNTLVDQRCTPCVTLWCQMPCKRHVYLIDVLLCRFVALQGNIKGPCRICCSSSDPIRILVDATLKFSCKSFSDALDPTTTIST